jgi:ribose transport system substrate-binding protein
VLAVHVREWVSSRRFGARLALGSALVALAVSVTACGSSSSNSGGGASGADATAASQTASPDKTAQIVALTKRPTHIAVTVPVGKPIPTGKKVFYIPPPLGDQKAAVKILGQAAHVLGWTSTAIVPTSATPSAFAASIDEALRQKADAIILVSFPGTALTAPIGRAKAQGVPVINLDRKSVV